MAEAGGARVLRESQLTVDSLSALLLELLSDPGRLAAMSKGARSIAKPDAAERLADLVEQTAG